MLNEYSFTDKELYRFESIGPPEGEKKRKSILDYAGLKEYDSNAIMRVIKSDISKLTALQKQEILLSNIPIGMKKKFSKESMFKYTTVNSDPYFKLGDSKFRTITTQTVDDKVIEIPSLITKEEIEENILTGEIERKLLQIWAYLQTDNINQEDFKKYYYPFIGGASKKGIEDTYKKIKEVEDSIKRNSTLINLLEERLPKSTRKELDQTRITKLKDLNVKLLSFLERLTKKLDEDIPPPREEEKKVVDFALKAIEKYEKDPSLQNKIDAEEKIEKAKVMVNADEYKDFFEKVLKFKEYISFGSFSEDDLDSLIQDAEVANLQFFDEETDSLIVKYMKADFLSIIEQKSSPSSYDFSKLNNRVAKMKMEGNLFTTQTDFTKYTETYKEIKSRSRIDVLLFEKYRNYKDPLNFLKYRTKHEDFFKKSEDFFDTRAEFFVKAFNPFNDEGNGDGFEYLYEGKRDSQPPTTRQDIIAQKLKIFNFFKENEKVLRGQKLQSFSSERENTIEKLYQQYKAKRIPDEKIETQLRLAKYKQLLFGSGKLTEEDASILKTYPPVPDYRIVEIQEMVEEGYDMVDDIFEYEEYFLYF